MATKAKKTKKATKAATKKPAQKIAGTPAGTDARLEQLEKDVHRLTELPSALDQLDSRLAELTGKTGDAFKGAKAGVTNIMDEFLAFKVETSARLEQLEGAGSPEGLHAEPPSSDQAELVAAIEKLRDDVNALLAKVPIRRRLAPKAEETGR